MAEVELLLLLFTATMWNTELWLKTFQFVLQEILYLELSKNILFTIF